MVYLVRHNNSYHLVIILVKKSQRQKLMEIGDRFHNNNLQVLVFCYRKYSREKTAYDILLFGYQTTVSLCGTGCLLLRDLSVNVSALPL